MTSAPQPTEAKRVSEVTDLAGRLTLSVEEAAAALGISRSHAWRMVNGGTLPSIRIGHRVLVPVPDLQKWILEAGNRMADELRDRA